MRSSCVCRPLFIATALAVTMMQKAAAEGHYHGREERLEISIPTSLTSNESAIIEIVNATVYIPLPDWLQRPLVPTWLATTAGVLALIGMLGIPACMCFLGVLAWDSDSNRLTSHAIIMAPRVLCTCSAESKPVAGRLLQEVVIGFELQYAFMVLACLYGLTRKVHQLPSAVLLLTAPWICRNLWLNCLWTCNDDGYAPIEQKGCCGRLRARLAAAGAILFGKFENLDTASDGLAVASAYFLSEEAERRFALSFASSTGLVGWLCEHLGLGNLMLAALVYGTLMQGAMAVASATRDHDFVSISVLGDLGGFAKVCKEPDNVMDVARFAAAQLFVALGRVCSESMLQALLQTSLLMAQGQSLFDQPVLAISICFSCTTLAVKAGGMISNIRPVWQVRRDRAIVRDASAAAEIRFFILLGVCSALATLAVLALILVKLYASQSCKSRMWGLTTGCVEVA